MPEIEFRTEFEDSNGDVCLPEDITCAEFSIFVGDDCLTRNRPRERSRLSQPSESVFGPVAGLADWFIENWMAILWETHTPFKKGGSFETTSDKAALPGLREAAKYWYGYSQDEEDDSIEETNVYGRAHTGNPQDPWGFQAKREADLTLLADWQHRHLLGHASSDLAIPSIVILPEGRNVVLSVDRVPNDLGSSVDFLGPNKKPRTPTFCVLGKTAFKGAASIFVDRVIERAVSTQKHTEWASWLRERWHNAQLEESDPKRRLESMLGKVAASRVEELSSNRPMLAQGLEWVLRDCPIVKQQSELVNVEAIVADFVEKPDHSMSSKDVPGWEQFGQAMIRPDEPDFDQGYKLARVVRRQLTLGDRPIEHLKNVLGRLDVNLEDSLETSLFRAAVCATRQKPAHIVPCTPKNDSRMESRPAYRFAVISALGRLLWESRSAGGKPICAAQGDHAMISQSRRANAFAAEFLLPTEAIRGLSEDHPDLVETAERYGISFSAARWHAHNVKARMCTLES
jgi:hypothetical protein